MRTSYLFKFTNLLDIIKDKKMLLVNINGSTQ